MNKLNYEWGLKKKWKTHEPALIKSIFQVGDRGNRREEIGARKSVPKKLKNNFLQYTWKLEEVQNLAFLLILFSQIFPDAVKYELTNICILYTDPQLITLLRSTAAQKKFLYYPVIGLRF